MRLIDGDALIDKYGDWYTEEGTEEGYIGTIKGIVGSMPTIEPEPKWIPCKERLPDKDGLYLVTYFSGHARWTGTDEFLVDGTEESHWKYANIIAWQPLPKPFREGGDYA